MSSKMSKMLLEAAVFLNDVHLGLEDADHDVTHVVLPPLSFRIDKDAKERLGL